MRRFEFSEGASNKFWEIARNGTDLELRWGRIGTQGQSQTKTFADAAKAGAALDKLVAEKTAKGYVETGAGVASSATSTEKVDKGKKDAAAPAAATPATAPDVTASAAVSDASTAARVVSAVPASASPAAVTPAPDLGDVVSDELPPLPVLTGSTPPWCAAGEPLDYDAAMKRLLTSTYDQRLVEIVGNRVGQGARDQPLLHVAGDHHDRDVGLRRMLADVLGQFQAVHVGQAQRRGHEIDDAGLELLLGFGAGLAGQHRHAGQIGLEHLLDQPAHDLGPVDHHHARFVAGDMSGQMCVHGFPSANDGDMAACPVAGLHDPAGCLQCRRPAAPRPEEA